MMLRPFLIRRNVPVALLVSALLVAGLAVPVSSSAQVGAEDLEWSRASLPSRIASMDMPCAAEERVVLSDGDKESVRCTGPIFEITLIHTGFEAFTGGEVKADPLAFIEESLKSDQTIKGYGTFEAEGYTALGYVAFNEFGHVGMVLYDLENGRTVVVMGRAIDDIRGPAGLPGVIDRANETLTIQPAEVAQ
ncbi:MAG: hypothetical protein KDD90_02590 [Sphingomonadaceae bacterium]|jgi:hypothetical protein|nr:hypothetical protein [Sphingomonadaceae bacterium]